MMSLTSWGSGQQGDPLVGVLTQQLRHGADPLGRRGPLDLGLLDLGQVRRAHVRHFSELSGGCTPWQCGSPEGGRRRFFADQPF